MMLPFLLSTAGMTQTVGFVRVGAEPDGSTWTTTLWLIGTRSQTAVRREKPMLPAVLTFLDENQKPLGVTARLPGSDPRVAERLRVALPKYADQGMVFTGETATSPAMSFKIEVRAPPGYLAYALCQSKDKTGSPAQSNIGDPYAGPVGSPTHLAQIFAAAFDLGPNVDTNVVLSNPTEVDLSIVVQAYDAGATQPFATGHLLVPAKRLIAHMLREGFTESPAFADHLSASGGAIRGILIFRAAMPVVVLVGRIDMASGGALVQSTGITPHVTAESR